ncbi:MAG: NAD-dependent epimerase/dehydratase family protein [Verrucomicrobiaceae bacterium]|nr:NAD-dependent epimerase/dehydratase family protein [Verrucomicrobiaceae bacterium]
MSSARQLLESDGDIATSRLDASALAGKRVLITGASGLIGTGIIAALRAIRVNGADVRITAHGFSTPPAYFTEWHQQGHLHLIRSDLADPKSWGALPEADIIIHAAGYGQPGKFMEAPLHALMLNTGVTGALLEKLAKDGTFLFFSSTEVYQGLDRPLLTESDIGTTAPDHPRSSYIEGKRCGEAFCHNARAMGIRAIAIRIAHTYGPGTRAGDRRVINMFIEKALREGKIAMQDEGRAVRTWGYITDTVETTLNILLRGQHAVYNIGGRSTLTIRELGGHIARLCGVPLTLPESSNSVAGAPGHVEVDLTRSEAEFGKTNYLPLEEGLRRTIEYQRHLYS